MSRKDVTDKVREVNAEIAGNLLDVIADTLRTMNHDLEEYKAVKEDDLDETINAIAHQMQAACRSIACKDCPFHVDETGKCELVGELPSDWELYDTH